MGTTSRINETWKYVIPFTVESFMEKKIVFLIVCPLDYREGLVKRISLFVCFGRSKEHCKLILLENSFPVVSRSVEPVY
jgi:hypothetical protein